MSATNIKVILAIDIGTSSVKCSIVQIQSAESFSIHSSGRCQYDVIRIKRSSNPSYSQQNVEEIFNSMQQALSEARVAQFSIDLIAICGQMHGVVLWNQENLFNDQNELNYCAVSDQYDWTDGRCDQAFLSQLPVPDCYADKISTGYGCATIFWLCKNEPDYIKTFNRAGTIMDFFAVVLCKLNYGRISMQNAHNFGYFDPETQSWNVDLLKSSGFPIELLPAIVPLNTIVGKSVSWSEIQAGIPVTISYGDMQSIVHLAFMNKENALVLNMGTSAQLCRLESFGFKPERKSISKKQSVDYFPFVANRYLAVAASLNGGNVLRRYAAFLQNIVLDLTGMELNEADVWSKLEDICARQSKENESQLEIQPTLFGERHEPESDFQLCKIRFEMPKLSHLTTKICASLLNNIFDMMALNATESSSVSTIICTGNVFGKNNVLQKTLQKVIDRLFADRFSGANQKLEVQFLKNCDADVGCALFAYSQLFFD